MTGVQSIPDTLVLGNSTNSLTSSAFSFLHRKIRPEVIDLQPTDMVVRRDLIRHPRDITEEPPFLRVNSRAIGYHSYSP